MIILLENIRSKHNVWSIFRSSDAFWVEKIFLTWFSKYPPDKEISKTAIWAENFVKWTYFQNSKKAIEKLKIEWRKIISCELTEKAKEIQDFDFKWNEVFVFGNEIEGVSESTLKDSDEVLKIPINWKIKESLNVSVAVGIVAAFVSLRTQK